jgi:hypothetical protein
MLCQQRTSSPNVRPQDLSKKKHTHPLPHLISGVLSARIQTIPPNPDEIPPLIHALVIERQGEIEDPDPDPELTPRPARILQYTEY